MWHNVLIKKCMLKTMVYIRYFFTLFVAVFNVALKAFIMGNGLCESNQIL
jgi:hypothetical protein